MGWLDSIVGTAKEKVQTALACPVPYLIDQEWPLTGRPKVKMWWAGMNVEVDATASNGDLIKQDFACGLAGWHHRMWCDFPTGLGTAQQDAGRPILCGEYMKNLKTNEEIWTVFPWEPANQGYTWQQMLDMYAGKITLADPPAKAPTSQFIDDPESPTVGPPPGTVLVPDPDPTAPPGSQMVAPGSKIPAGVQKAGFPVWIIPVGVGLLVLYAVFRKKGKGKKGRKSKKRSSSRPAYEMR